MLSAARLPRIALIFAFVTAAFGSQAAALRVEADLSQAPFGLYRSRSTFQAQPGPLTVVSAKWIPGEHAPSGPVRDLAGIRFLANGQELPWRRDPVNLHAMHLVVPEGVSEIVAQSEYLIPTAGRYGGGAAATPRLAIFNWTLTTLFPETTDASLVTVEPSVTLPDGWSLGTALKTASAEGALTRFAPTTLELLLDQPVLAGANFKTFDLAPGTFVPHVIHAAADSPEALALSDARLEAYRRLPVEMAALTGVRHYNEYHFLLTLTDTIPGSGIEHHQSSDNRTGEKSFIDDDEFTDFAGLLTHEYFHSWCGKHRRPARLLSPGYMTPMQGDLLWVYEGLTTYYGDVLAVRTGLRSASFYRDELAADAQSLDRSGRRWRSLEDTATAAQELYGTREGQRDRRRAVDFYGEGAIVWLEADCLIRSKTNGARSLDDFVRLFLGDGQLGAADPALVKHAGPSVRPYEEGDVVAALNTVCPHDWASFFQARVKATQSTPPTSGIEASGWRAVYSEEPNPTLVRREADGGINLMGSLGFSYSDKNEIADVRADSPAAKAGLFAGQTVYSINGRKASRSQLKTALKQAKETGFIELIVESGSFVSTHRVHYSGGLKYPSLERVEGAPDYLNAILAPRWK